MTSDKLVTATVIFLIVFGCGFIAFIISAAHSNMVESNIRRTACYNAGGIPIDQYCVKPGSFIEVK